MDRIIGPCPHPTDALEARAQEFCHRMQAQGGTRAGRESRPSLSSISYGEQARRFHAALSARTLGDGMIAAKKILGNSLGRRLIAR